MAGPDFSTYEGRQAYRDSHPGVIVDASGAYNPYNGQEVNSKGQAVRDTGKEPNRGPAPIGNDQAFGDLTPITGINRALNDRAAQVEQQVQQAMANNQIPSGPSNQNSFITQTVANILKATQAHAAQLAAGSPMSNFNPQGSTADLNAAGFQDSPTGRYQYALAQEMARLGGTSLGDMQSAVAPVQQAYEQQQQQAAGRQQTINGAYASSGNLRFAQPYSPLGLLGGGQSYLSPYGQQQQQPDILSMIMGGLMGSLMGGTTSQPTTAGPANATAPVSASGAQPYIQQAQAVGNQLGASPAAQQQVGQYTLQPLDQGQQSPRQIPGSLFSPPSTQLYSAFSPSEKAGLMMFGNGLGISNQDMVSQILNLAPPSGYSVQSYAKPSVTQGY